MNQPRVYLDHAATSFPKPREVLEAVQEWYQTLGVSAARGEGDAHRTVAHRVERTRAALAKRCGVPSDRLAFVSGATEGLNLAFSGLLSPGDRVVTTALEHSSVARPLTHLRDQGLIELVVIAPQAQPGDQLNVEAVRQALAKPTRLLVFTSASNVTGAGVDTAQLVQIARDAECLSLCDASQTAGSLPLDFGADVLTASAHKGLLGPPGLGFLAVREGTSLATTKRGGTGSSMALDQHPETWPECLEAGTPNTPAILGLDAALTWSEREFATVESMRLRAHSACRALRAALREMPSVQVFGTEEPAMPIVSFAVEGYDTAELGMLFDTAGVEVRTGFHCAPWIHDHLGSTRFGGTVRVSPGPFVTESDVLRVSELLETQ